MRITITLGPEADALIRKVMTGEKRSFDEIVSEAIVRGLSPAPRHAVVLPTHAYGPPLVNLDKASQLAGELEDEQILRKMLQGR